MLASLVFFSSLVLCTAVERDVTRDYFGDIFRMRDCHVDKRTPCDGGGSRYALEVPGRPCYCQCAPSHFTYREDRAQCVREIRECYMSVFYRPHSVESIPLVFLPTSGQLVHPDAHLSLAGRHKGDEGFPKCKAAVSQYMTLEGWKTISREGSHGGSIFGLFLDANKTFLQFLGSPADRQTLQHTLLLVRLYCKLPEYAPFETCVAVRIGWSPGVDSLDSSANGSSKTNMMVVGLSLGVLGLVYVLAVLVYLKIRRRILIKNQAADSKGTPRADPSEMEQGIDPSKRLDMYHTHTLGCSRDEDGLGVPTWGSRSAIEVYNRNWADRPGISSSEFQAQDFQLQPEFFEPEFLASPPKHMVEFLEKLQTSVAFARHRLRSYYRYRPTLIGIPEDDYFYQDQLGDDGKLRCSLKLNHRPRPDGCSSSFVDTFPDEAPKPPPRKSRKKRKFDSSSTDSNYSNECMHRSIADYRNITTSEEEKEEIQSAMDTLNDTLEALELDIFRQDLSKKQPSLTEETLCKAEKERTKNSELSSSNKLFYFGKELCGSQDVDSDSKDFETSSCSSMSAVTVLNKNSQISETGKTLSHKVSNFHGKRLGPVKTYKMNLESSINNLSETMEKQTFSNDDTTESFRDELSSSELGEDSLELDPVKDSSAVNKSTDDSTDSDTLPPDEGLNKDDGSEQLDCNSEASPKLQNGTEKEDEAGKCSSDEVLDVIDTQSNGSKDMSDNIESYQRCKETEIVDVEESLRKYKYKNKFNIRNSEASDAPVQKKKFTRKLKRRNGKKDMRERILSDIRAAIKDEVQLSSGNIESAVLEILQKYKNNDMDGGTETEMTEAPESDKDSTDGALTKPHKNEMNDLKRPPSTDSVKTNITQDSLESSRSSSRQSDTEANLSVSLVDAWINRLYKSSTPTSGYRNKDKKSAIQADNWTHICDKQNMEPCPVHENMPSLIDKLAQCGLKAMGDCDVSTYFQTLKQDVLSENLRSWLASHQNIKSSLSVSSRRGKKDCSQRKPLLPQSTSDSQNPMDFDDNTPCDCPKTMTWSTRTRTKAKNKQRRENGPKDCSSDDKLKSSADQDSNVAPEIEA